LPSSPSESASSEAENAPSPVVISRASQALRALAVKRPLQARVRYGEEFEKLRVVDDIAEVPTPEPVQFDAGCGRRRRPAPRANNPCTAERRVAREAAAEMIWL
jgi:hypothetical protein